MAHAIRRRPKLSRKVDTAKCRWKMERHLQRIIGSGSIVKDNKSTWQKSCRESSRRESRKYSAWLKKSELKRNVNENTRVTIIFGGLKRIRKLREEEETLKELLEDVQDKKKQQEDDMWNELEEYMTSWERTNTLSTKIW